MFHIIAIAILCILAWLKHCIDQSPSKNKNSTKIKQAFIQLTWIVISRDPVFFSFQNLANLYDLYYLYLWSERCWIKTVAIFFLNVLPEPLVKLWPVVGLWGPKQWDTGAVKNTKRPSKRAAYALMCPHWISIPDMGADKILLHPEDDGQLFNIVRSVPVCLFLPSG